MNNNCIYLKQKINRTLECKKKKKIINIKECNNCKLKEYKKCTKFSKNSANHTLKNNELRKKSTNLAKLESYAKIFNIYEKFENIMEVLI